MCNQGVNCDVMLDPKGIKLLQVSKLRAGSRYCSNNAQDQS